MNIIDWFRNIFRPRPLPPGPAPSPPLPPPDVDIDQLLLKHNQERSERGVGPLFLAHALSTAAQAHAQEMAGRGLLDHESADGSGPWDRARRAGYSRRTIGENIALGQNSPAQVMRSWMNSSGHRGNILNAKYRDVGFGIAKDARGRIYWCALFGG